MTGSAAQRPSGPPGPGQHLEHARRFAGATERPFACGSHSHPRRQGLAPL